eukprot:8837198-Alexandrium_andersonii.AAC.1
MVWAGWVFHAGVFPATSGAAGPGVEAGVWFHPVLRSAIAHAQARCPHGSTLVLGAPPPPCLLYTSDAADDM